jgi:hypothetical protein
MKPFKERRRFRRFSKEIPLLVRLFGPNEEGGFSYDIPVTAGNIGRGGMMVFWPRGWVCPKCRKCGFGFLNESCKLDRGRNSGFGDSELLLHRDALMATRLAFRTAAQLDTRLVWMQRDKKLTTLRMGLRFLKEFPSHDL